VKIWVRILDVSFFIKNNLSYLVGGNITSVAISATTVYNITSVAISATAGGNITSVAISATAGGNITSVALSDTCFSVLISSAYTLRYTIYGCGQPQRRVEALPKLITINCIFSIEGMCYVTLNNT